MKLDQQLEYIRDVESIVRFECRTANCHFATDDSCKLFKHEQSCRSETEIICKQVPMHRPSDKARLELIAEGIIPNETWYNWHFATFDAECFMDDADSSRGQRSIHRLVSIGLKFSFGEKREIYLEREDMEPWSVRILVQDFLATLINGRSEMFEHIPTSVIEGQKRYMNIVRSKTFKHRSVEKQNDARAKLRYLNNCLALRIYSWNGERYDHNVLWAPLMDIFANGKDGLRNMNIIRRGTGIMEFTDGSLVFRDFMNMTSPMTLEKFHKLCSKTSDKTTFPYEHFRDICSLRTMTDFTPYKCFRSSLLQDNSEFVDELEDLVTKNVTKGDWLENSVESTVNDIFQFEPPIEFEAVGEKFCVKQASRNQALALLHTSPKKFYESKQIFDDRCETMADYLRNYNLNDVILLEACITSYAQHFYDTWGVNIHDKMSLPGVAQDIAFRKYDESATAIYTFGKNFKHYNDLIRKQLHGGMTLGSS